MQAVSLSLSLSLSTFTTCYHSLQTVWIHKIVQRFAGPDEGQTSIPRVNLVRACPTYNMLGIFIYLKEKENFRQVPQ